MPDRLVPVVIVIAIVAIIRGDVSKAYAFKVVAMLAVVSAFGFVILYVPTWLYQMMFDRDAPSWLTIITTVPVLVLAYVTYSALLLPPPSCPNRQDTSGHNT